MASAMRMVVRMAGGTPMVNTPVITVATLIVAIITNVSQPRLGLGRPYI